jgi:hypothetical protein
MHLVLFITSIFVTKKLFMAHQSNEFPILSAIEKDQSIRLVLNVQKRVRQEDEPLPFKKQRALLAEVIPEQDLDYLTGITGLYSPTLPDGLDCCDLTLVQTTNSNYNNDTEMHRLNAVMNHVEDDNSYVENDVADLADELVHCARSSPMIEHNVEIASVPGAEISYLSGSGENLCTICGGNGCNGDELLENVDCKVIIPENLKEIIARSFSKCLSLSFLEKDGSWLIGGIGKHCLVCLDSFPNHYHTCRHIIETHGLNCINFNHLAQKTKYFCRICGFYFKKHRFDAHLGSHLEKKHNVKLLETENCIMC